MSVDSTPGAVPGPAHPRRTVTWKDTARVATLGTAGHLVWSDVRAGLLRVAGLTPAARALARVGFVIVLALLGALLLGDPMRHTSELLSSAVSGPGRASTAPVMLLPLVLFVLTLAWSYLLAGAVHAHPLLTAGITLTYLAASVPLWQRDNGAAIGTGPLVWLGWAGLLGAVATVLACRLLRLRPGTEFALLLGCVSATYLAAQLHLLSTERVEEIPRLLPALENSVLGLGLVVTPLLVMVGLSIANFVYRVGTWTVVVARTGRADVLVPAALVVLAAGLLWLTGSALARLGSPAEAFSYLVALVLVALWCAWYAVVGRAPATTTATPSDLACGSEPSGAENLVDRAGRTGLPLAAGFFGWQVLLVVALSAVGSVSAVFGAARAQSVHDAAITFTAFLTGSVTLWQLAFDVVVLAVSVALTRRGQRLLSLFLGMVALTGLWFLALQALPGPLALWWDGPAPLVLWGLVATTAAAAVAARRGQLTHEQAQRLLVVGVVLLLVGAPFTVSSPFSPFLLSSGLWVIVFGLLWDIITSGSWANRDTAALPHASRVLLYLGYLMLSLAVIVWARASHDLTGLSFLTGAAADLGFAQFGVPLLAAVCLLLCVSLFTGRAVSRTDHSLVNVTRKRGSARSRPAPPPGGAPHQGGTHA